MSEQAYPSSAQAETPIANVEAEAALLGALLTKNSLFDKAIEQVSAEDFYEPVHARVFAAIQDQIALGRVVSPVSLRPAFAEDPAMRELGGPDYLAKITGSGAALLGVSDFARQINELAQQRNLHDRLVEQLAAMRDLRVINPARHAAAVEGIAFEATATKSEQFEVLSMSGAIGKVIENVQAIQRDGRPVGATAPDLPELTEALGPLIKKHLVILAGRPSMGKSALLCAMARSIAMGDLSLPAEKRIIQGVGVVSLEMSDIDLGQRFAADVAYALGEEVPHSDIRDAKLTDRQLRILAWAAEQVRAAPIKLADVAGITMARLAMIARRMKRELQAEGHDLHVLYVDYLQLLHGDGRFDNKTAEITAISQGLKRLAKELDCCVVALSQLSRQVEQREVKIPQLSDLRESGSIEQDADTVGFLYREAYYLKDKEPDRERRAGEWAEWDIAMNACRNHMDVIVSKRRGGPVGRCTLTWIPEYSAVRGRHFYSSNAGALYDA